MSHIKPLISPDDAPAAGRVVDEVDKILEADAGLVLRERNPQLYANLCTCSHGSCHHGPTQQCIHCCSLQPFDDAVQKKEGAPIKFMSFHTYLKKLSSGADKSVSNSSLCISFPSLKLLVCLLCA